MPDLEHDPNLIKRLAQAYQGNAEAHYRRALRRETPITPRYRWSVHEMLAASSCTIAASYWSMIEPRNAIAQYRKAAEIYQSLQHSYWILLAFLSSNVNQTYRLNPIIDEMAPSSPQFLALAFVSNALVGDTNRDARSERLDALWKHFGNVPTGRLAIPLDYYARWAHSVRRARSDKDIKSFFAHSADLLNRTTEVFQFARNDRFHWKMLQTAILPAEPEAVALTKAISTISSLAFGEPATDIPNLDGQGRFLIQIGDDLQRAATEEQGS